MNVAAKMIAKQLIMERTHLLQVLAAPGWTAGSKLSKDSSLAEKTAARDEWSAAEQAALDYIYRVIEPLVLDDPALFKDHPQEKGE